MKKAIVTLSCIALLSMGFNSYADSYLMHTIKNQDTYSTIGEKYDRDIEDIKEINEDIDEPLKVGELLKIKPIKPGKTISIEIDGNLIETDQPPYIENDRTFVPIRFIAQALNLEVHWDDDKEMALLKNEDTVIKLKSDSETLEINGENKLIDAPVNVYRGRTFVPVRFIAETLNCIVDWDPDNYIVKIRKVSYSEEDILWLSKIVEAEAKDESFDGKLAVANVIINRKESSQFPNTIKEVIYDNNNGYQFTPVVNGEINNNPSEDSIKASKLALEGENNIDKCLYFLNPKRSVNSWVQRNRKFYKAIENHNFYY